MSLWTFQGVERELQRECAIQTRGDNGQDSCIYTDVGISECLIRDLKQATRSEGKILHSVNTWQLELLSAKIMFNV